MIPCVFFSFESWAHSESLGSDLNLLAAGLVPPKHLPWPPSTLLLSHLSLPPYLPLVMDSDLLSSVAYFLSAAPTSPSHDQLDVTVYENGFPTSALTAPVLSDSGLSNACIYPRLFVAIRSVLVHAAIRWPSVM